jgi:formamidopyrimidine-DNA glycosylase (fpg)
MPELPEVETIRNDLEPLLVGRRVTRVDLLVELDFQARYVRLDEAVGRNMRALRRRGKYLIADLGDRELIVHLGMTGQVGVKATDPGLKHLRVAFTLDDGAVFFFADQRRFGKIHVVSPGDYAAMPTLAEMGPEPMEKEFRFEPFAAAMNAASNVKALLLSQKPVSGLGNIYVDEALHLAKIHPARGHLTRAEAKRLFQAIPQVLSTGITNRGTTFKDYRDGMGNYGTNQDFLLVYDRAGEPCRTCQTPIVKLRVAQRGTYICPRCQRL